MKRCISVSHGQRVLSQATLNARVGALESHPFSAAYPSPSHPARPGPSARGHPPLPGPPLPRPVPSAKNGSLFDPLSVAGSHFR